MSKLFSLTCFVAILCGLGLSGYAAQSEVILTDLDGNTTVGSLVEFGSQKISISNDSKTVEFAQDKILEIKSQTAQAEPNRSDEQKYVVFQLSDETQLVGTDCSFIGRIAKIKTLEDNEIPVQLDSISIIRFNVEPGEVSQPPSAEFRKIANTQSTDDRLIAGAVGSLDEYSGIILEINADTVRFDLDGEILPVSRKKVAGVIFRPKPQNKQGTAICVFSEKSGSHLSVEELSFDKEKDEFIWKTASGLTGTTPFVKMSSISFGHKNMTDLFQLTPVSIVSTPIALWNDASEQGPLELLSKFSQSRARTVQSDADSSTLQGIQLNRKNYSSGFTLLARTDMVYSLSEDYQFLRGIAGIDDRIQPQGNVRLTIRGNDTVLFNEAIKGDQPARAFNVNISGFKKITITADVPEGISSGLRLNLVDVKLVK